MAETRKRVKFATKRRKGRMRVWKYRWVIKKGAKKTASAAPKATADAKPAPAPRAATEAKPIAAPRPAPEAKPAATPKAVTEPKPVAAPVEPH